MRSSAPLRSASVVVGSLIFAVTLLVPASSASASPADDGFWYYDAFHIQDAHDSGLTGKGVTIAVIDTQINLSVPTLIGANIEVQPSTCWDESGALLSPTSTDLSADHGTNIVSYLVGTGAGYPGQTGVKGVVPDATIIYTSVGQSTDGGLICSSEDGTERGDGIGAGINAAVDAGADIISLSVTGLADPSAVVALARALHEGIAVVASVVNEAFTGDGAFPASGNGVVGVQSMDASGAVQGGHTDVTTDVVGPGVDLVWQGDSSWDQQRYATGTSLATPIVAGFLALVAQKYPDATGNQLVQTLLRNTGADDHELIYDSSYSTGYGVASATHMLRVDPTQYDDVNFGIVDGPDQQPTAAMIASPPTLEEYLSGDEPDPSNSDPEFPTSEIPVLPILVGAIGLLIVIVLAVVLVILASRRARAASDPSRGGSV